jgi:hypothetical protein
MAHRLLIHQIIRTLSSGGTETLDFEPGVNVIVGPANSGKTTWLRMLDFLMGDSDSAATLFDDEIVRKYRAVGAQLRVGERKVLVERRWVADGSRSQMLLDGARFNVGDFQQLLLNGLQIPVLQYPQGNVYTDRTWSTLGWRSLLRHIYRRQEFWGGLVPQQPESEQHACLLQFLGIAEYLFSDEYAKLVDLKRQIARLQARKDSFMETVHEISPNLLADPGLSVGVTTQSILAAQERLDQEVRNLVQQRNELLLKLRDRSAEPGGQLARLLEQRAELLRRHGDLGRDIESSDKRLGELQQYESALQQERDRLERTEAAAAVFEDLRITNCPACDQSLDDRRRTTSEICFLCGQPTPNILIDADGAARRLKFERDQLAAELAEARQLLGSVNAERRTKEKERAETEIRLRRTENALLPFQAAVAAILPEEVALIDQAIGARNEKREALQRLVASLQRRDQISAEIDQLQSEAKRLESALADKEEKAELETASDRLTDGFNTYLNEIRRFDDTSWTTSNPVTVRVTDRNTRFLIGRRPAMSQLGGTLTIYFLFAYHYALLSLSRFSDCHYPGLTILDLFPEIIEGVTIRDRLGLVLDPFVELSEDPAIAPIQVIATGTDFPMRPDIHRITLNEIWR